MEPDFKTILRIIKSDPANWHQHVNLPRAADSKKSPVGNTGPGGWVENGADVDPTAFIDANSYVRKSAKVGAGASIRNSQILDHAIVGERAIIINSEISNHAEIGKKAYLFDSTVKHHAKISDGTMLDGCTIQGNTMTRPGESLTLEILDRDDREKKGASWAARTTNILPAKPGETSLG